MPINEKIRVSEMMVIGPNGEQLGVKRRNDALTLASYAGLDLVLLNANGNPAVAKIMDYNKYRYEKQKKLKEQQKRQRENTKVRKISQMTNLSAIFLSSSANLALSLPKYHELSKCS